MAVQSGKTKKEAQITAGYKTINHSTAIEASKEYQALKEHFGTDLEAQISIHEINSYLVDNIRQEGEKKIDRNARNKAIEMAKSFIEPESGAKEEHEKVLIVLSK